MKPVDQAFLSVVTSPARPKFHKARPPILRSLLSFCSPTPGCHSYDTDSGNEIAKKELTEHCLLLAFSLPRILRCQSLRSEHRKLMFKGGEKAHWVRTLDCTLTEDPILSLSCPCQALNMATSFCNPSTRKGR